LFNLKISLQLNSLQVYNAVKADFTTLWRPPSLRWGGCLPTGRKTASLV